MAKKWASEAERSRSRRAYQRAWRNRRNYLRLSEEIVRLEEARRRSWDAWSKAAHEQWGLR